jgi:hypothetical protein
MKGMAGRISHTENAIDARNLRVRFSPEVQDTLSDIAAIARLSEHFDSRIYEVVKDWSNGKRLNVHDVMIALPAVAGEVAKHISATKDGRMEEAWDQLSSQILEDGFIISQSRQKQR